MRERSRPWIDAKVERASDDLYVIADIGKLKIELHAAEALLRKAGQVLDQVSAAPITAQSAARASIAVAEAKVLTTEVSLLVSEKLFDLAWQCRTFGFEEGVIIRSTFGRMIMAPAKCNERPCPDQRCDIGRKGSQYRACAKDTQPGQ